MADTLILLLVLAMAANGFRRGSIKEIIHFILWFSLGITMAMVILETVKPEQMDMENIPKMLQDIGTIFGFAYLMVIVLEKFIIIPIVFKGQKNIPSLLSRITGATFGACKMLLVILVSTFLHKVYSDDAAPELPPFFASSEIVYFIDDLSIDLYEYVTDKGWIAYNKIIWEEGEDEAENPLTSNPLQSILNSNGGMPSVLPKFK